MCNCPEFFIVKAGRGRGCPVISEKAYFITRYSSTSYNEVMNLSFGEVDALFLGICRIIEEENEARKKAMRNEDGKNA